MCHQDFDIFDLELFQFTAFAANISMIGIADYSSHRCYILKTFDDTVVSDIAGVPYLIAPLKILGVSIVPISMCIAYDSYLLHYINSAIYHSKNCAALTVLDVNDMIFFDF
jgi:hypothetical protein